MKAIEIPFKIPVKRYTELIRCGENGYLNVAGDEAELVRMREQLRREHLKPNGHAPQSEPERSASGSATVSPLAALSTEVRELRELVARRDREYHARLSGSESDASKVWNHLDNKLTLFGKSVLDLQDRTKKLESGSDVELRQKLDKLATELHHLQTTAQVNANGIAVVSERLARFTPSTPNESSDAEKAAEAALFSAARLLWAFVNNDHDCGLGELRTAVRCVLSRMPAARTAIIVSEARPD